MCKYSQLLGPGHGTAKTNAAVHLRIILTKLEKDQFGRPNDGNFALVPENPEDQLFGHLWAIGKNTNTKNLKRTQAH